MPTISQKDLDKLSKLAAEMAAIVAAVTSPATTEVRPEVRDLVREMLRRRQCLYRTHRLADGENPVRGMCETHKAELDYLVRRKKVISEHDLVVGGWWTNEPQAKGRKPKSSGPFADVTAKIPPTQYSSLTDEEVIATLNRLTGEKFLPNSRPDATASAEQVKADAARLKSVMAEKRQT